MDTEPVEVDLLTDEQGVAIQLEGAQARARWAKEELGVDLKKCATSNAELLKLSRGYCAHTIVHGATPQERMLAVSKAIDIIPQKERESRGAEDAEQQGALPDGPKRFRLAQ